MGEFEVKTSAAGIRRDADPSGVSIDIPDGAFVILVGALRAAIGKSTLLP